VKVSDYVVNQYEHHRKTEGPVSAWQKAREDFITNNPGSAKDVEQSWKSASGNALEKIVLKEISKQIEQIQKQQQQSEACTGLKVYPWNQLPAEIRRGILSEQVWKPGTVEHVSVESKVDIVVVKQSTEERIERVVAVYSSKVSVAERYQQDLFWVERFRERRIRFCFATIDESFVEYATNPPKQLQNQEDSAKKNIMLASALYDRIYLFTDQPILNETRVLRTVAEIGQDLLRWCDEL